MSSDAPCPALHAAAVAAMAHAYAPYSGFTVGAALRTADGAIFAGCNVETAHYKGFCAEGSAIAAMVSNGGRLIRDIVIVGPHDAPCPPCGDCRQRIREFADPDTLIHLYAKSGRLLKTYRLDALLPESFGPDMLARKP